MVNVDPSAAQSQEPMQQKAEVSSRGSLEFASKCCNMQGQIIFTRCVLQDSAAPDCELMWHGGAVSGSEVFFTSQ